MPYDDDDDDDDVIHQQLGTANVPLWMVYYSSSCAWCDGSKS